MTTSSPLLWVGHPSEAPLVENAKNDEITKQGYVLMLNDAIKNEV